MELKDLKLGPPGYTRIALLGTATSSMELAPFRDPSWAIWACSPGAYPVCAKNRSDAWFEPHLWKPTSPGQFGAPGTKPWFSPEFHAFLKAHKGPVFMSKVHADIPSSVRIPYESLMAKYGRYFWQSTVTYMLAMAIDQLAPRAAAGERVALGLWGIDMSANEEWAYQRPSCQHFLGLAMSMGIDVVLPEESDLMRPPTMYGIGEHNPRHIKLMARLAEVRANLQANTAQAEACGRNVISLKGAEQEILYQLGTWSDDIEPDLREAVSFAQRFHEMPAANTTHEALQANTVAMEESPVLATLRHVADTDEKVASA